MQITKFVEKVFAGKFRKTGEPYVTHLHAVHDILLEAGVEDQYILDAALLHDVLEDTSITKECIEQNFGKVVTQMVITLSKEPMWHTSYCKFKSYLYSLESCAMYYPEVILIKMADRLHNLMTIEVFDFQKQVEYIEETEYYLFPVFRKAMHFAPCKKPFMIIFRQLEREIKHIKNYILIPQNEKHPQGVS
ncbi:HD domain-containing protein [Candidatus Uabimicrobium amorphum]|uniref:(P)ppGpp synthetase n=1 Tax=Uabimicrobium amorphum TaxID=2596890 RepID=A0A5S9ISG5_UABAM|nr:HD domain-containing protein [Candidatus Uabimicrobium amorphum]BBM87084.1 (p)ppGpp synthetase [Candidatus Uabimicrobium amorphum]